ncbi:MAG TPA: TIGR03936 family radical SAM-associated protein [Clostridia bacterium]|nr:TIGR03936 family radical SAM-associated protein [Clostridia bacterium]
MSIRLIVRYTKGERVKYISHLDFVRLVQRAIRRADIPVAYSQGFNPHPKLSFASALAVGTTSQGEYLDIILEKDVDPELLCKRMNEKLPAGISFEEGRVADEKLPSLMSLIERAGYIITMPEGIPWENDIPSTIDRFLMQQEILITRTTRRGRRQIDIRPMIHEMDVFESHRGTAVKAMVSAGSKANLRPELLMDALLNFAGTSMGPDLFFHVHRLDLYLLQEDKWVTPIGME